MAHVHDHYGGGRTTVVETDTEGPATALMALIGIVIIAALIWFFAFSGVVFNRSNGGPTVNIQNPPAQQNQNNTNTYPQPSSQTSP